MVNKNQRYLNIKTLFTKFLIFFYLITLIKSNFFLVIYKIKSLVKFDRAPKMRTIGLDFHDWSKAPDHMKLTLTPEKNFLTPILFFCPRDRDCLIEREELVKRTDRSPAILFLKREQYIDLINEIFIHITCLEDICAYSLAYEDSTAAEIEVNSIIPI